MKFQENPPPIDPEQDAINKDRLMCEADNIRWPREWN
jgi:hypothetical protein